MKQGLMSQHNSGLLEIVGMEDITGARVAIVSTQWNREIISALNEGCGHMLKAYKTDITDNYVVPGAFELPFACRRIWEKYGNTSGAPEAIIAFGAVIRGGTPHFDYVCNAVTDGIVQLNLQLPVPVIFGVLTLDNEEQAWERLGGSHGHKGEEAAITALKMISFNRSLK